MTVKSETGTLRKIRLGTRGSPLALYQARLVQSELAKIDQSIDVEIRIINTSGDWRPEQGEVRLEESSGGKALFAKELEEALLAGEIDCAVHSMKDMETRLPRGLIIPCMLPREDVRDAFLSNNAQNIDDLPIGSVIGTVSVRRAAFLLSKRPDLRIVPFRGNVQTRLDKLHAGQVDATLLACAGLKRLGLLQEAASLVPLSDMLPAVGQGAIGVEMRADDSVLLSIFSHLNCYKTNICVTIERFVLDELGGSCHTPVGVHALIEADGDIALQAVLLSPDGAARCAHQEIARISSYAEAETFGRRVGRILKDAAPKGVL